MPLRALSNSAPCRAWLSWSSPFPSQDLSQRSPPDLLIHHGDSPWAGSKSISGCYTATTLTNSYSYALQWLFALPLEVIAGALTVQYWNESLSKAVFVTIFLIVIAFINLFGIKGYGEAEFIFSTIKVAAIVGFM